MAPRIYPHASSEGADSVEHRTGRNVDSVDQTGDVALLCSALAGASAVSAPVHFVTG